MSLPRPTPPTPTVEHRLYLREEELDQAVDLLFAAARRFWRAAEGPLAAHNLGPAHYRALAAVRRRAPVTVGALRAHLDVTKQSLARVLNEIEAAGLIGRAADPRDRRARLIGLTAAGAEAERAATAALRERLAHVFRAVGAEAVSGARAVLAALAEDAP